MWGLLPALLPHGHWPSPRRLANLISAGSRGLGLLSGGFGGRIPQQPQPGQVSCHPEALLCPQPMAPRLPRVPERTSVLVQTNKKPRPAESSPGGGRPPRRVGTCPRARSYARRLIRRDRLTKLTELSRGPHLPAHGHHDGCPRAASTPPTAGIREAEPVSGGVSCFSVGMRVCVPHTQAWRDVRLCTRGGAPSPGTVEPLLQRGCRWAEGPHPHPHTRTHKPGSPCVPPRPLLTAQTLLCTPTP